MLHTPVCDILGIQIPIFQGPMGGATTPALAAAVANAGGLGMLPLGARPIEDVRKLIKDTLALTNKPIGINLVLEWDQKERLAVSLDEGIKIVWFFWGDPTPFVKQIHQAGGKVIHTVGSSEEAKKSVDGGVDVIVAQGWEAGGHLWGQVASLPLIPSVVDVVGKTPVIAAGGIANGRGFAAALALGAQGVVLGTRLVASEEAGVHKMYKEKIVKARETDTTYNDIFDIGWPNSWMRTLRNSTYNNWEKEGCAKPGKRPGEKDVITHIGDKEVPRYSYLLPMANMEGDLEAMALYAGQSAGLIHDIKPVKEIINHILAETNQVLTNLKKYT